MSDAPTADAAVLPDWAAGMFAGDLDVLRPAQGAVGAVFGVAGDPGSARISEQFKLNAEAYHDRYSASSHFQGLFEQGVRASGIRIADQPLVLDLGSGSGVNSIVPWFALAPGARQVATDLSGELLAMLADHAVAEGLSERLLCVRMDAMGDYVRKGRFDLVTGASILHHLVRPARGIRAAFQALRPGGHALFMEPFQGYGVIRLAYERILAEATLRSDPLPPATQATMRGMIADITARTMPDPTRPEFADLDDKWLFSREHIEHAARSLGFTGIRFVPHNDHDTLYRDMASIQIRLNSGDEADPLPPWAIDILDGFDAALPPPVKRMLNLEATIVLTKPG